MSTTGGTATWWQRLLASQQRRQLRFAERSARRLPGWRTRARQRLLVRATAAGLALMLVGAVLVAATGLDRRWAAVAFAVTWVGGTGLATLAWFALRVVTSNVADLPARMLDEREADQRGAVRSVALQVTLWAALVPTLLLLLGSRAGEPSAVAYPAGLLLAVVILLGGFTPAALLAWDASEADDQHDD